MIQGGLQKVQASARKTVTTYDAHLRWQAERSPRARGFAGLAVSAPWTGSALFLVIWFKAVGGSLWLFLLVVILAALLMLGGFWAMARFIKYSWAFERTPPAAPWTGTEDGQALIQALGRVTLNSLTAVTPETRLRTELRLTGGDISELLAILKKDGWLDADSVPAAGGGALTVGDLLDAMARCRRESVRGGRRPDGRETPHGVA